VVVFEDILIRILNIFYGASIFFLIAVGLNLIYGVMKLVNLAHTALFAFGAYIVAGTLMKILAGFVELPVGFLIVIPPIAAGLTVLAVSGAISPLLTYAARKSEDVQLILTFGLLLIFEDIFRGLWGPVPVVANEAYMRSGMFSLGDSQYPLYNIYVMIFVGGMVIALWLFLHKARVGMLFRATSMDIEMTSALGADVRKVIIGAILIAGLLAGLGGGLYLPAASATLGMSIEYLVYAFVIIVIGGLGSFVGSLLGSFIVSALRTLSLAFFPELELALLYVVAITILLIKPEGLGGGKGW
jgi:branched-chain amino acid transport system permease protein